MGYIRFGATAATLVFALLGCKKDAPEAGSKDSTASTGTGESKSGAAGSDPAATAFAPVQVAAGLKISFARMSDGSVRAWGINDSGTLGNGKKGEDAATPVEVLGLSNVVQIDTGSNGTGGTNVQVACARLKDGRVQCWGSGSNPLPTEDRKPLMTPTDIPSLKGATQLSLGTNGHGCAVMSDKTLKCWGYNAFGEVGVGDMKPHYEPTIVPGLAGVAEVKAGHNHTCARLEDGTFKCWGWNFSHAALPASDQDKVTSPTDTGVKGATALHAGSGSSCAVVPTEGLICWGSSIDRSTKSAIEGAYKMVGTADVVALDGATDMSCALEKAGTVKCWGDNKYGQLGSGAPSRAASYKPVPVIGISDAISLDVGTRHACVATQSGKVLCWGYNQRGELGDGTIQDRPSPVEVKHLSSRKLEDPENGYGDVKESSVTQTWSSLPAGCKHEPKLDVSSPPLGLNSFEIQSAYASRSEKRVTIKLANFRQDPKDLYWDEPRGKQALVSVSFYKADIQKKEALPLDLGSYDMDTQNERYAVPSLRTAKKSYVVANITLAGIKAGSVTLTHLSDDWVCGTLDIHTKEDRIVGPFAAKVVKE